MRVYRAMRKVLVAGSFELLHAGHLHFLKEAKAAGDFLVAVVATDDGIRKTKQREPLVSEKDRLALVSSLKIVDKARLGGLGNPYDVVGEEKPAVVVLGYDQAVNEAMLRKACVAVGAELRRASAFKEKELKSSILAKKIGL